MMFPIGWTSLHPFDWGNWPSDDWWSVDPADINSNEIWPSPNTINRTGSKMIHGECPGRKYKTSLGLEQVVEVSEGILPKEVDSLEEIPEKFRDRWATKKQGTIPRVATGIPNRVDRLKALGNGQVPLCVKVAWEILIKEVI